MWPQLSTQKWLSVKYHPSQAPANVKMVKITFPTFLMRILGNFLVSIFGPPPLLSILYMGLTGSVLTYPNLWPQRSAP